MLSFMLFAALSAAQAADVADAATGQIGDATETGAASIEPSGQRLICRSRPVLGSRIARQRICKTAAGLANLRERSRGFPPRHQRSRYEGMHSHKLRVKEADLLAFDESPG